MNRICVLCGLGDEVGVLINHHTSYFPEITVVLHRKKCHSRAHHEKELGLCPPDGHAKKFRHAPDNMASIRISQHDRALLSALKKKGETYDDVIRRLLTKRDILYKLVKMCILHGIVVDYAVFDLINSSGST